MIGAAIVALVAVPAALVDLRGPQTIEVSSDGLVVRPPLSVPKHINWNDIESARLWRAPMGQRPTVVSICLPEAVKLDVSEVEYSNVRALIHALNHHRRGQLIDDRKSPVRTI